MKSQNKSEKIEKLKALPEEMQFELLNCETNETKTYTTCEVADKSSNKMYIVQQGSVWRKSGTNNEDYKYLANFTARPTEEIIFDDGGDTERYFIINGRMNTGERLPEIKISAADFTGMNWIIKYWGISPRMAVSATAKDYFRDYIQSQSANIERRIIYTHTGFREINGEIVYLYHGGSLGNYVVECNLEHDLRKYTFVETAYSAKECIAAVLNLMKVAPEEISYPLLAFTYLTPLKYFLDKAGVAPGMALFCKGETGSFKTALSMLYLSHFRKYNGAGETPPSNFHSTANAIEKLSFILKDMPLLVDDYHPTTQYDKTRMDGICQRISRNAGDNLSRGRLNSDMSLQPSYVPRGLFILTGEDLPDIGQSGLARFHFIGFKIGDIDKKKLTECQNCADKYNSAMQYYINWLIKHSENLSEKLHDMFIKYRDEINIARSHNRTASNIAWLKIGLKMFFEFASSNEIETDENFDEMLNKAVNIFTESAKHQVKIQSEEKPVVRFLSSLDEMLTAGIVQVNSNSEYNSSSNNFIGYSDNEYLYLIPQLTISKVNDFNKNITVSISKNRLLDDLAKLNLIEIQNDRNTVMARFGNTNKRYIKLRKSAFDWARDMT